MDAIMEMNSRCDDFYKRLASVLTADDSETIMPEKLAKVLKVNQRQLINAVWNGTMDIGWGHRNEMCSERRHTVFSKVKVWRYFYGRRSEKND